jgi:hypothetical protein
MPDVHIGRVAPFGNTGEDTVVSCHELEGHKPDFDLELAVHLDDVVVEKRGTRAHGAPRL